MVAWSRLQFFSQLLMIMKSLPDPWYLWNYSISILRSWSLIYLIYKVNLSPELGIAKRTRPRHFLISTTQGFGLHSSSKSPWSLSVSVRSNPLISSLIAFLCPRTPLLRQIHRCSLLSKSSAQHPYAVHSEPKPICPSEPCSYSPICSLPKVSVRSSLRLSA